MIPPIVTRSQRVARSADGPHETAALIEVALEAPDASSFQRAVLEVLQRSIGFECAIFGTASPDRKAAEPTLEGYSTVQANTLKRNQSIYEAELLPVRRTALLQSGVAIDTVVLGPKVERTQYYQDLVRPAGGGHSLLCYLEVRGTPSGTLILGRERAPFRDADVVRMQQLRAPLTLGAASFGSPARSCRAGEGCDEHTHKMPLTAREQEIAHLVTLGYTNKEIALAFGTSANTVRNQLATLFRKLGATTRAELVAILLR